MAKAKKPAPAPSPKAKPGKKVAAPAKPAAKESPANAKTVAAPAKTSKDSKPAAPAAAPLAAAPAATTNGAAVPKPAPPSPPRPIKRPKPPPVPVKMPAGLSKLLDSKGPSRKPLIPSGPKASQQRPLGSHTAAAEAESPKIDFKSPFNKRELDRFRSLLVRKRAELVGDVATMENEALLGQSGSLSNTPSHMAEQGSEAYDQSLSLDLAAADRRLIKEIDDAIARINNGTFGVCQITGKPIKADRLEELPWARYSIEAARELERQAMRS